MRNFLKNNLNLVVGDVVDVGCGGGKYKNLILGHPGVKSYTGVDFYAGQADIVADLNKGLPIEDNKFDSAICISVLEHLLEPQNALNEIARILKPSAHLLFSAPWMNPYHGSPHDYFRYSGDCLKYLLEKAGFEIISIIPTGGRMNVVLAFIRRWYPFLNKFATIDKLRAMLSGGGNNQDTPSYSIIAKKK